MKRRVGLGWLGGVAFLAVMSAGCGDDGDARESDTGALAETVADVTADSAAEVESDTVSSPETLDTTVAETETVAPDAVQDAEQDLAPDTTPADTAADLIPSDTAEVAPAVVTWDDVYPIFATSCTPCHAGAAPTQGSGGHALASPDKAVAYDASQLPADLAKCAGKTIGECALIRIQDGSMPASGDCQEPLGAKCPDLAEQALIQQWIADGMRE